MSDLVQDSGVGPLGSALGSTSPYSVPPGQEPFGQRFPNFNTPKVSRLPVCDFGELCGARGACSLEEQAWGVSLSGVPGGDGVNCHEQRDPAHEATKPVYGTKATWGAPFRSQGGFDLPYEHGLYKKFLYAHLGGRAAVHARESSLQGKFRQSADNGHQTN